MLLYSYLLFQSINNHESGQRHIGNVQKKLNELRRKANSNSQEKMREKISLINDVGRLLYLIFYISKMAFVGMMKDIERDPSLAERYGVDLSDEQFKGMKEKVNKIQKDKQEKQAKSKNKKNKKEKPVEPVPVLPVASKPIIYEWKEVKTADGRIYYWNKKTGVTQWERPKTTIQPANDSECVSHEKKRLDQFLFSRLVELSESGSAEASSAVCQAFGASAEDEKPSSQSLEVEDIPLPADSVVPEKPVQVFHREELPRMNLLGEWQAVIPE